VNEIEEQLELSSDRFIVDLQSSGYLNETEFSRVDLLTRELATLWKGQAMLPKQTLHTIQAVIKALKAEAPHLSERSDNVLAKARAIELTFDLILLGEDHSDRVPGTPRII